MSKQPNPGGMTPSPVKRTRPVKTPNPGGMSPSPVKQSNPVMIPRLGGGKRPTPGFYHPHGPLFGQ